MRYIKLDSIQNALKFLKTSCQSMGQLYSQRRSCICVKLVTIWEIQPIGMLVAINALDDLICANMKHKINFKNCNVGFRACIHLHPPCSCSERSVRSVSVPLKAKFCNTDGCLPGDRLRQARRARKNA